MQDELVASCRVPLPCSGSSTNDTITKLVGDIKRCTRIRDLELGKKLHHHAVARGIHADKSVSLALIKMYSGCRSMASARQIFGETLHRDIATWNSIILGYVENGEHSEALEMFFSMDCQPDSFTYVGALKACGGLGRREKDTQQRLRLLETGVSIHKQLDELGSGRTVVVETSLVDMYRRCGSIERAKRVFDEMKEKNVVTWTCLILGYVDNGDSMAAIKIFESMDCEPDRFTLVAALKACGSSATEGDSERQFCLEKGIGVHEQVRKLGLEKETVVATALLDMYSKCGSMHLGRKVFNEMREKNVVTWTSLIMGYVENAQPYRALDMFDSMDCEPNYVTYVAVLKAYGALASSGGEERKVWLEKGTQMHRLLARRRLASNVVVENTLIDMYRKCGCVERSKEVFDGMRSRSVVSWTSLILGYVAHGEPAAAMKLFSSMDCEPNSVTYVALLKACAGLASEGVSEKEVCLEKGLSFHEQIKARGFESDQLVAATLVDMYGKCGCMERARTVFDRMKHRHVVAWTSLILGYEENGNSVQALKAFTSMDCEPDSLVYVAVLKACGSLSARSEGQQIHARACRLGLDREQAVAATMMDFYVRCGGCITRVEELFNNMHSPSIVSWNTLIAGYRDSSHRVFGLVKEMEERGVEMDAITFTGILTSCSHGGLVDEGKLYLDRMVKLGLRPSLEQYNCMVDMLGRANRLQEALALIDAMPVEANEVTWTSLLEACRKWKNVEIGKVAFQALVERSGSDKTAAYVLLSDAWNPL